MVLFSASLPRSLEVDDKGMNAHRGGGLLTGLGRNCGLRPYDKRRVGFVERHTKASTAP